MRIPIFRTLICLALTLGATHTLTAAPIAFTDRAAFDAAVSGLTNVSSSTLDFDGLSAGTTIADGGTVDGITFNYSELASFGIDMQVSTGFDTTSGSNFLGTTDADLFLDGDNFSLDFGPVNAIGMYFISADPMFDDDITLTAGGATASLVASDEQSLFADGGVAFFLGIIDDAATFTSASIETIGLGAFLYNVDDIVTAKANPPVVGVAEPGILALFALGLVGLGFSRRRPS